MDTAETRKLSLEHFADTIVVGVEQIVVGVEPLTIAPWSIGGAGIALAGIPDARKSGEVRTLSREFTLPPQVEMAGIEPASDSPATGLLRVQFAADFLGPSDHANKTLTGSVT